MMPPTQPPLQVEYAMFVQKNTLREELVKIAFKEMLPLFYRSDTTTAWQDVGLITVKAADAVLAAMEQPGGTRPTCQATPLVIRRIVQNYLDSRLTYFERNPAGENERVLGHRSGIQHACNDILDLIDTETEKPQPENDDGN